MRWKVGGLAAILLTVAWAAQAAFGIFQVNGTLVSSFSTLKVGGGGFVTGFDLQLDGTKLARTDTYGVYLYNLSSATWRQLVTKTSMPVGDAGVDSASNGYGVYEAVAAPTNTNYLYMNYNGYVFFSTDKGATWTRSSFTRDTTANTSDNYRGSGKMMAVDPNNENIVYAGTPTGLFKSSNGASSWATDGGVTAPTSTTHGGVLIAFDNTSTHPGNVTQGIYACSYGNGVYHTTNGGTSWSLTSGTPTTCNHMIVDAAGIVWLVDDVNGNTTGALKKFSGGSWSTALASGNNSHSVAVNPADGTKVYTSNSGSQLFVSTNTGGSFVGATAITVTASDIPWLVQAGTDGQFSNGDILFDPAGSNLLYNANGIGVFTTTPPTSNVTVVWNSQTAGVENLDMNIVVGIASGKPLITAWDRPGFVVTPGVYPSSYGGAQCNGAINSGYGGDVDPTGAIAIAQGVPANGGPTCGTSSSTSTSSISWSVFASQTPITTNSTGGGCLAASTTTHFLWMPKDNGSNTNKPWTTTNGGTAWTAQTVGGTISTTAPTGWGENYYNNTISCAADKVTADTYYLYNDGQRNSVDKGVWISSNGGSSWSQTYAGGFTGGFGGAFQMKAVPGQAGNLFISIGNQGAGHPAATNLYRSTDFGHTWQTISNVSETFCVGFGFHAPSQSYPAVYFVGWVSGTYGVWRSIDNFATGPVQIGDGFPSGSIDPIKDCYGDMGVYGTVYFVTGGNGAYVGAGL